MTTEFENLRIFARSPQTQESKNVKKTKSFEFVSGIPKKSLEHVLVNEYGHIHYRYVVGHRQSLLHLLLLLQVFQHRN
jgi:hypothetical protein